MKLPPRWIIGLKIIGLALLYAGLAKLVLAFFSDRGNVTLIWFPAGLGLAAFLLNAKHYWAGVLSGAFIAGLLVGDSWTISAFIAAGNTLESWIGAWLLLGNPGFSIKLRHPSDFAWLAVTGAVAACFSALIGPMALLLGGYLTQDQLFPSMLHWWMADLFGIALVTPCILIWRKWPTGWFVVKRLPETATFLALSFFSGQAIFLSWCPDVISGYARGYWTFLFVVWAAARFGRHGVMLLIGMTAIQSLWGLERQCGLFASGDLQAGLLNIWLYLLVLACVGIPLALMLYDREQKAQALQESENRLSFALQTIDTGAWDLDLETETVMRTPIHDRIFGYDDLLPVWTYQTFLGHVVSAYRDTVDQDFGHARRDRSNWNFECKIRRLDGEIRWIRGSGRHHSLYPRMTGIIQDITLQKLADENRQLAMLFYQNCNEGMMITEVDATIVSVNPAFSEITGYEAADVIGKNASILGSGRHDSGFFQDMWQTINSLGQWHGEIWNRRKNGELYVEQLSINTVFDANGLPLRRIGLFFDVTQRKLNEEQLRKQAYFDPLTGIGNRRMFYDRLDQEIKKAHRSGLFLALLLIDIDKFKEVNDRLGYTAGDQILREAAQRILRSVRETDLVARMDGVEFGLILTDLEKIDHIERIADTISQKLGEPFVVDEQAQDLQLYCRIGIAVCPDDADAADRLQQVAAQALKSSAPAGHAFANMTDEI
ncbi:diguanylate cyclase domain-containing protein [Methylomonas sp. HW2-6]|uniref:diguanylate cyclase domain-containing protein n=1 Tax=Methylomonas sp. HW2-6 TaxID=3376687 RepID=UPI004041D34E